MLSPCARCATLLPANSLSCPHCGAAAEAAEEVRAGAMLLLGLTMAGPACIGQPKYGVAVTDSGWEDADGDGYTVADGDCDDDDDTVHPDAEETAGDGVDSNCNGEDDT